MVAILLLAAATQIAAGAPQPVTGIENAFPAWSPDGAKILFQSNRSGEWHLYLMRPDGSDVSDLTPSMKDCRNPSFSPDGSKIVFYSAATGNEEIYVMKADGSGITNLTNNPAGDIHPHWSPDGKTIIFNSYRDDPKAYDVYTMKADGTGVARVTATAEDETCAQWSPDGKRLVFLRGFGNGNDDIMVAGGDAQGAVNLSALVARRQARAVLVEPDRRLRGVRDQRGRLGPPSADRWDGDIRRCARGVLARRHPHRVHPPPRQVDGHLGHAGRRLICVSFRALCASF